MRTFSLVEGTSDKFWSIDVVDASVTVNYGRTGTRGQTKTTQYESAEKARVEADKLIASKVRKGYTEGEASGGLCAGTGGGGADWGRAVVVGGGGWSDRRNAPDEPNSLDSPW